KLTPAPDPTQPRIANIKLYGPKPRTISTAITLNPHLAGLLEVSLLMRRDLTVWEQTSETQKDVIRKREVETTRQARELNVRLRNIPKRQTSQNKRDVYSLQCAVQALEEVREDFKQRKRDIDRDIASRREQYCSHQAEVDKILDDVFRKADMIPPQDETANSRPTLDNLDVTYLEIPEGQTPLQAIIAERLQHFDGARGRLTSQAQCLEACWKLWKEEHRRGDDLRSEGTFVREHKEHEDALRYEYQVAEEGYRCLLDAEKLLGKEDEVKMVPHIVVTPARPQRRKRASSCFGDPANLAYRPNLLDNVHGVCSYDETNVLVQEPEIVNAADALPNTETNRPPPQSPAPSEQPPPQRTKRHYYYRATINLGRVADVAAIKTKASTRMSDLYAIIFSIAAPPLGVQIFLPNASTATPPAGIGIHPPRLSIAQLNQARADLDVFIDFLKGRRGITVDNEWIDVLKDIEWQCGYINYICLDSGSDWPLVQSVAEEFEELKIIVDYFCREAKVVQNVSSRRRVPKTGRMPGTPELLVDEQRMAQIYASTEFEVQGFRMRGIRTREQVIADVRARRFQGPQYP
ncbi:hypothetical protein BLS_001306, partial [Venturia inaequalis]